MTALTPDDLARIEELAKAADRGPWTQEYLDAPLVIIKTPFVPIARVPVATNAAFIASARTDVPALVAGVRSLQARITELEGRRIITDAQELDALPEYSVILDKHQDVWQFREGLWYSYETAPFGSERIAKKWGPLVVLHRAGDTHE